MRRAVQEAGLISNMILYSSAIRSHRSTDRPTGPCLICNQFLRIDDVFFPQELFSLSNRIESNRTGSYSNRPPDVECLSNSFESASTVLVLELRQDERWERMMSQTSRLVYTVLHCTWNLSLCVCVCVWVVFNRPLTISTFPFSSFSSYCHYCSRSLRV